MPFNAASRTLSFTPSAVKSPVIVLFKCHAGSAFLLPLHLRLCIPLEPARRLVLVHRHHHPHALVLLAPTVRPSDLEPTPDAAALFLSDSDGLFLIHAATSKAGRIMASLFCSLLADEPHLVVKPLHAVLAALHALRVLVVNDLCTGRSRRGAGLARNPSRCPLPAASSSLLALRADVALCCPAPVHLSVASRRKKKRTHIAQW